MKNRETNSALSIDLDSAELLILKGGGESDDLSSDHLLSGMQNGTKVSVKPTPGAPPRL